MLTPPERGSARRLGFAGSAFVGLPVLVKGPLGAGPQGLGILFSASGLGALAGTVR